MKKTTLCLLLLLSVPVLLAQVGVGTTAPNSSLDVRSSNQATPASTDGILIPKIDAFPAANPTAAQQGMLVYLTTNTTFSGNPKNAGFYYWNNPTLDWVGFSTAVNGDHDWYEEGTTTPPDNINDDMYHTGNVGIGTNTPAYKLDIVAPGNDIGIRLLSGNANQLSWLSLGRTYEYAQIGATTNGTFFTDALNGDMAVKNFNTGKLLLGASYIDNADLAIVPGGYIGVNNSSPASLFDIRSTNVWNTTTTEGDFRIGDPTYRFKVGVALAGAGAGDVRLTAQGGTNRLFIGSAANSGLVTVDGGNNRVGIKGLLTPNSALDVNGDLALREGAAITVANGVNALAPIGEFSHYRLTGATAAFTVSTIANGNDGQLLTLINATGQNMTIANNNVANGILTGSGVNLSSTSGTNASISLIYNATLARWIVQSHSGMADANAWNITGNAGTNPAGHFIGTTDNVNLMVRTNNAERMRVATNGTVGIATTAGVNLANPYSIFDVAGNSVGYGDVAIHSVNSVNAASNWFSTFKSRGTHTAPTLLLQEDEIGSFNGHAYDGTQYIGMGNSLHTAYMTMSMDAPTGANDLPSRIAFGTTADGTSTAVERMRINNQGIIGINTAAPSATDRVNVVSGTTMNGMLLTSQLTTAGSYGLRNNATLNGGTANIYTGYSGNIPIAGGTTTNAGIYSDVANSTAAAVLGSTNGTATSAAVIGTSTVWNGVNARTSAAAVTALVGVNTAAAGAGLGHGIFGQTAQRDGAGLYAFNSGPAGTGFGWVFGTSRAAVVGDGVVGGSYAFGVMGDGGSSVRSGAVFGDDFSFARGSLGYFSAAGVDCAVYGFGLNYQVGIATGKGIGNVANNQPDNMVGLGIYGGVLGGWVRGNHYGFHAKGSEYGLYVDGTSVTNKPIVQLIENGGKKRSVSFAPSSMSADVYVRGNSRLEGGSISVIFDKSFSEVVSEHIPLNITVTPTGPSNGVYVTEVTRTGFRIVENGNGTANVSVNWVAYGTRIGYENPQDVVSDDIAASDFDEKMDAVMYNDNNTDGKQQGIWYDGSKVNIGQTPKSFAQAKLSKKRVRQTPDASTSDTQRQAVPTSVAVEPGQVGISDSPPAKGIERSKPREEK